MAVWNLLFSSIVLPLIGIALLWIRGRKPLGGWVTTLLMAGGLAGFAFFVAPWGTFGIVTRWVIALLFAAAALRSWMRKATDEPDPATPPESPLRGIAKVLIGFLFGGVAIGALRGREVPPQAVDLSLPVVSGRYLVLHGGSTPAANMHAMEPPQRYAVDLVKVNAAGFRAAGVFPSAPSSYFAFGAQLVSPCDGTVVTAVDDQPDGAASSTGTGPMPNPLGNHVTLRCGDLDVVLGHLQRGSVTVRQGTSVVRGAPIARAGHSGASPEPHVHIHAERNGAAVPLTFRRDWLVRNEVVSVP